MEFHCRGLLWSFNIVENKLEYIFAENQMIVHVHKMQH